MKSGKPESYIPGIESTKQIQAIVRAGIKGESKPIPGIEGPFVDPYLIAIGTLVRGIVTGGNAREIKKMGLMLDSMVRQGKDKVGKDWSLIAMDEASKPTMVDALSIGSKPLQKKIDRWVSNDVAIFIDRELSPNILNISLPGEWMKQSEIFPTSAHVIEADRFSLSGWATPASRWMDWKKRILRNTIRLYPEDGRSLKEGETTMGLLVDEPRIEGWGQMRTIDQPIKTGAGSLTLRDLASCSPEAFSKIEINDLTELATGLLGNESVFRKHLARAVFLSPIKPPSQGEVDASKPEADKFYGVLNLWRQFVLADIILPTETTNDEVIGRFLKSIDMLDGSKLFGEGLATNVFRHYMDLFWSTGARAGSTESVSTGLVPLIEESNRYFQLTRGGDPYLLAGAMERPYVALGERLNPLLTQRLTDLNYGDKFKVVIDALGCKKPWEEMSGEMMEGYLIDSSRVGVVGFGEAKREQIEQVTKSIWRRVALGGVSYIQSLDQITTIVLDRGSIATRAGIDVMRLAKSEDSQKMMNVLFQFDNRQAPSLGGFVSRDGKLHLRTDLSNRLPGYHSILENVAVSQIYDLVRTVSREQANSGRERIQNDNPSNKVDDESRPRSRNRLVRLPRRSRSGESTSLNEGSLRDQFTTRHVEGHPTALQGASRLEGEYKNWTKLYLDDLLAAPIEERGLITSDYKEVIRELDAQAHKISSGKENNIPFGMRLRGVILPFASDNDGIHICFPVRKTETWTVPHVSPAVTDEERGSLSASFEKRFRNSGSQWLEWLEYMYLEGIK